MDGPMAGRNACDDYCELHAHSNFSFLDGASHPEDLVARAALLEMPALAITDLAGEKQFPVFERGLVEAALDDARGHLIGLSGCRNGEIPRALLAGQRDAALDAARRWAAHFPEGDFVVELSHHRGPDDDWLVAQLAALADDAGLPTVVTNEVHYAEAGGHRLQDVLVCIRHGASLDEARELLLPNAEYRVKPGRELAVIGAALPDARARRSWAEGIARAGAIGSECRLEMDFERWRFPGFTVREGQTPFSCLYH